MSTVNRFGIASLRRWRRIAAVVGMSLALVAVAGAPARAATGTGNFSDNFEAADADSVWTSDGVNGYGFVTYSSVAHSPTHQGYVYADVGGWGALGRSVHLPVGLGWSPRCSASIWIRPLGVTKLNIEVIDPSSWTYISLKTVTIGTSGGGFQPQQQITVPSWAPSRLDVVFRVSQIYISDDSIGAYLDDLKVICNWF